MERFFHVVSKDIGLKEIKDLNAVCNKFDSKAMISYKGTSLNCKLAVGFASLNLVAGTKVEVTVSGSDEGQLIPKIKEAL